MCQHCDCLFPDIGDCSPKPAPITEIHNGFAEACAVNQAVNKAMSEMPISGLSTVEPSQGLKYDQGKRRMSLLPSGVLTIVVDVLEIGARKYSENNWQKVEGARTRYYDAALRHIDSWWNGELYDLETGKHHLAHATCCMMFLIWLDLSKKEVS